MKRYLALILIVHFGSGVTMADPVDYLKNLKPTEEMKAEAKNNPNGWVYAIEGNYGPDDAVPPEAIAGAWKVDGNGKIMEDTFMPNPNYRKRK